MKLEDLEADNLRFILDAVVDYAIYVLSPDGRVLTWNAGAEKLKGYTREEIVGQSFHNFFTPEDREAGVPQRALETAATEGKLEAEGWRVRKDGSRFWAMAVLDAIKGQAGETLGFVKITRDLTERKIAQQQLLDSERRYRVLIDSVVDYAIFQLNAEGRVTTWNPGAQRIMGYTPEEIIGQPFSLFYLPEDRAAALPERALEVAAREGRFEAEAWRQRKDSSKFQASVVIDPIRDEHGTLIGFAKVTRDITERYQAQERLKATQAQLAVSQKMEAVGQLSGGIAHDFNNLLMIVLGSLEMAQRSIKNAHIELPNLNRAIDAAMRGAQRAAALTSRLLAFSRRQALDPKALDLNKVLSGSADFIQRSLGETIQVEMVGAGGLWQVELDPNHLESALLNLAINARDAMPKGGRLMLETSNTYLDAAYCRINPEATPGPFVMLSVSDTGSGMPPDVVSRVFEPFFTTKEVGQGTGLGLSQVYGFVKQSLGYIKVYSEEGLGTSIKMYFPKHTTKSGELEQHLEDPSCEGEEGETILVVEDDDDLRDYICQMLADQQFVVLCARDAESALSMLDGGRRIDLLLTDVVMPGASGRELATKAQQSRVGLPILFMTGYPRNAVVHHGRLDEGIELLQKPFSQSELTAKIRATLDIAK